MKDPLVRDIEQLLRQVPSLTVAAFQLAQAWERDSFLVRKSARPQLKLGAADFSWLDRRVRETVGPLVGALTAADVALGSRSVFMVLGTAQAIVRRDRLTEEQYEAFVGGFRRAGVIVPGWRDGWAASAADKQ